MVGGLLALSGLVGTLLVVACLEPPPIVRRDAGPDAPLPPVAVTRVHARSFDGRAWPLEAIPRRPWIEVELSRDLDDADAIFVLEGAPDAALEDDLRTSPLRSEHLRRAIACDLHRELGRYELAPRVPLAPGAQVTLAVGAWARSGRDTLGEPVLVALTVSTADDAGATATTSWPPDGASDVGTTLEEGMIRFDGALSAIEGIDLVGPRGPIDAALEEVDCTFFGLTGTCVAVVLGSPLDPLVQHQLVVDGARDVTGAPVPAFAASFRTAAGPDDAPPSLVPTTCALDETPIEEDAGEATEIVGCLLVTDDSVSLRVQATEAVVATARIGPQHQIVFAPRGVVRVTLSGFAPSEVLPVTLTLFDTAARGNDYELTVATAPTLPRLSIAEVRADPLGREPTQEYVELVNDDVRPLDLGGFFLADAPDREGDALPSFVLSPGARVLLVADAFDADDVSDSPAIPLGARLLRVGPSLGEGGLGNSGEPLYLRDATPSRISVVPSIAPPEEGACLVRRGDLRSGDPRDFEYTRAACSPGTE